jgi:D-3-phosphoglycerate dehydrogenase
MAKVLIAVPPLVEESPHASLLEAAGFDTVAAPWVTRPGEDVLLRALEGVAATIAGSEPYTRRVLEAARELRVIARVGVGFDDVDVETATERGIAVTITPGANDAAVAEQAFALILGLAKGVVENDRNTRAGSWVRVPTIPLRGATLGIVGLGRIGRSVARRARAFDMRIVAYEPQPDADFVRGHAVELVPFERLLTEADFVTLHVPLIQGTRHLIDRRTLALMKPTAYLVNTARGGLVCEADLIAALEAGTLAGAALDVFEVEPPKDSPLWRSGKVLLSPHLAGIDRRSFVDMASSAARSVIALSRGEWPEGQLVNREVKTRFRW